MKTLLALTTFSLASLVERLITPSQSAVVVEPKTPGELTEEVRRYDIEDLMLP